MMVVIAAVKYVMTTMLNNIQNAATMRPPRTTGPFESQPPTRMVAMAHHADSQTPLKYGFGNWLGFLLRSNHQTRCAQTNSRNSSAPQSLRKSTDRTASISARVALWPWV